MTEPGSASRTNGFLFADLRDYTGYVESHGDRAAAALLDVYRDLVRTAVAGFGGAEIKTEGDSFYVVFPSASTAVQCGLAILAAAAPSAEKGDPIRVGIGVHAGETVETAEGYVGSAVNVAARVCSQARAGELLVTDTVRALTRTHLQVRFVDRRTRRLKGIVEPVVLYRAEALPEGAARPSRRLIDRLPSLSGIPLPIRIVLLVGLFVGGLTGGYLLVTAQHPPATASPTPSPGVTQPTEPASTAFPNGDESDLLDQLPSDIRVSCARSAENEMLSGAIASVRCDLDLAAEADTVWYDRFATRQSLTIVTSTVIDREHLQRGECDANHAQAQGNWQVGGTHSGQLLCYQTAGSTWVVWSYDADRIVARATRSGDAPGDWLGLFDWWRQASLFLH